MAGQGSSVPARGDSQIIPEAATISSGRILVHLIASVSLPEADEMMRRDAVN